MTDPIPTARLGAVALDASDVAGEAGFWRTFLGLQVVWESDDFVALRGAPVLITVQRVEDHRPPQWPDGEVPKQLHLEISVSDLDASERAAVALGAVRTDTQPQPDRWRVLVDPAGHPFCLSNQIPEP